MVSNIHILLGLETEASWDKVSEAYKKVMDSLDGQDFEDDDQLMEKVSTVRERLVQSYAHMNKPEIRQHYQQYVEEISHEAYCRPKLGELLVAFGLLDIEELDAALEIQRNTNHAHVPLGELLVATGYLNHQQLNYYLRMQCLFKLPPDHPERWGQRLVELGLVTEDQLKVALIEQKTTNCSLREALINRGWLTAEVLDRIF